MAFLPVYATGNGAPEISSMVPCPSLTWPANGITDGEMKCFIAVTIVMGLVHKDTIEDYWSTDAAISTPFFQNVIPRGKFGKIMSFFHLADNDLFLRRSRRPF